MVVPKPAASARDKPRHVRSERAWVRGLPRGGKNCMAFFDKDTLRKSIAPKVTSVYQVLKFDRYPYEVLLSDIMQRPPVDVWVDVSPVYVAQVMQWQPGTVIHATIKSEVFTVEEKVQEMGWSKEGCEKMLQETGYSWDNALVKYYFEGKIAEIYERKRGNTHRENSQ